MKSKILQWLAIVFILFTGYLHLITAAEEYSEARYMGVLFLLNFLGALVSAVGIYRQKIWWGWVLGIFITAGSILGYIQSRTFGMPGMEVEEWYDPIGISALIVEGLFLIVFALAKPWAVSVSKSYSLPLAFGTDRAPLYVTCAMLVVVTMSYFSYQSGLRNSEQHLLPERIISAQTLEEEYGIRLQLVAITAGGGMVDVRYRILDPDKAVKLIDETDGGIMPMVYVYGSDTMLMSDMHMRTQKLIANRTYFELIPNTQNAVIRGAVVTVAFGNVALEPMVTK
jgi:hypothetical protein